MVYQLQADKLQTILKAAKVEEVEPIWTTLFAKARISPYQASTTGALGIFQRKIMY